MSNQELSNHPASELFPMMSDEELTKLAEDIKANGLQEPIALYEQKILDGRNRYAACKKVGVEPQFTTLNGGFDSPYLYVVSKNLHRRHLTPSQLGAIGAEMVPHIAAELKRRLEVKRKLGVDLGPISAIGENSAVPNSEPETRANKIAAAAVGVGHSIIGEAIKVKKESPEAFEKIKQGKISVNRAAELIRQRRPITPKEKRHGVRRNKSAPYKPETKNQINAARAEKQRLIRGLSAIKGVCSGLRYFDAPMAASVSEKEELKQWATIARDAIRILRDVASKLEVTK